MFFSKAINYSKIKMQLANAMTLLNLSFGIIAIIFVTKGFYHMSLFFVILAAIFDRFDGMIARKYDAESLFGKELDSLSDLVSFGVAPALLIYQAILVHMLWVGIAAVIFYILAGAVRLARYNVKEFDGTFSGVPITVAGVLLASSYFLVAKLNPPFFVILLVILGLLMVSSIKIAKV